MARRETITGEQNSWVGVFFGVNVFLTFWQVPGIVATEVNTFLEPDIKIASKQGKTVNNAVIDLRVKKVAIETTVRHRILAILTVKIAAAASANSWKLWTDFTNLQEQRASTWKKVQGTKIKQSQSGGLGKGKEGEGGIVIKVDPSEARILNQNNQTGNWTEWQPEGADPPQTITLVQYVATELKDSCASIIKVIVWGASPTKLTKIVTTWVKAALLQSTLAASSVAREHKAWNDEKSTIIDQLERPIGTKALNSHSISSVTPAER